MFKSIRRMNHKMSRVLLSKLSSPKSIKKMRNQSREINYILGVQIVPHMLFHMLRFVAKSRVQCVKSPCSIYKKLTKKAKK